MSEIFKIDIGDLDHEAALKAITNVVNNQKLNTSDLFDEKADLPVTITLSVGQLLMLYGMIGGFDGLQHEVGENGVELYDDILNTIETGVELAWPGCFEL